MFRRRTGAAAATAEDSRPGNGPASNGSASAGGATAGGASAGKGRPTPKRSEAEQRRRQPYAPPAGDRKAAGSQDRDRRRAERARRAEAMRRGEEWAMQPKDKGPVRKLARDYIDARRTIGEYYIFAAVLFMVLLLVAGVGSKTIATRSQVITFGAFGLLLLFIGEGWYHGTRVMRLARQRFPDKSTRGLRLYTAMRGMQSRRLRVPKPAVSRGDKI